MRGDWDWRAAGFCRKFRWKLRCHKRIRVMARRRGIVGGQGYEKDIVHFCRICGSLLPHARKLKIRKPH